MSRGTRGDPGSRFHFAYRTFTLYGVTFQTLPLWIRFFTPMWGPHDPAVTNDRGLGCSPFARRYLGNRGCFLFLGLLRWFSSPRSLSPAYVFSRE